MTIREAIQEIETVNFYICFESEKEDEAFYMAYKALKALEGISEEVGRLPQSWEYGSAVQDCLRIIHKYKEGVENGKH